MGDLCSIKSLIDVFPPQIWWEIWVWSLKFVTAIVNQEPVDYIVTFDNGHLRWLWNMGGLGDLVIVNLAMECDLELPSASHAGWAAHAQGGRVAVGCEIAQWLIINEKLTSELYPPLVTRLVAMWSMSIINKMAFCSFPYLSCVLVTLRRWRTNETCWGRSWRVWRSKSSPSSRTDGAIESVTDLKTMVNKH